MKFGVNIVNGKILIERYKENKKYADVIEDKYYYLKNINNPAVKNIICVAKKEFSQFILENFHLFKKYKDKIENIKVNTVKSEPYYGKNYVKFLKYKEQETIFLLYSKYGKCLLSSQEKVDKGISGYFDYAGESAYGFVYTISQEYSDTKTLFYRPIKSKSIESDIIIDEKVNQIIVKDNLVIYTKHIDNYFSPKFVYLYDLKSMHKQIIFETDSKEVIDLIDTIYFDNFRKRVIIVNKTKDIYKVFYYDLNANNTVWFYTYKDERYAFYFDKDMILVLKSDKNDYSYLYRVSVENFYIGYLNKGYTVAKCDNSEKNIVWFDSNKNYLFYCTLDKEHCYNLIIYDKKTNKKVYDKYYKGVEFVELHDNCYYTKNDKLIMKLKIFTKGKLIYTSILLEDNYKIMEDSVEKLLYKLEYDHEKYIFKRDFVNGIPVDIYYLDSGLPPKGAIVEAYGAYGHVIDNHLNKVDYILLEENYLLVTARVRGGGDLGTKWHEEGKLLNKINTINDTITVCEYISKKYLNGNNNIVIRGVSAGGIAVAGALNKKPELFRGVVLEMAFLDVLNSMLDKNQPLTELEYEEWGNPEEAVYYYYIKSYCPYTNLKRKRYPNVWIISGINDKRVLPHEGLKFYMKLKENNLSKSKVLYELINTGHFFEDEKEKIITRQAYFLTFVSYCLL